MNLYTATQHNNIIAVTQLLETGSDVNKIYGGERALHVAIRNQYFDIMILLLKYGADPHCKDFRSISPFSSSLSHSFLAKHISCYDTTVNDEILLHLVVKLGLYNLTTTLLNKGTNVNTRDIYDRTPLHYAVQMGDVSMFRLLVSHGSGARINLNCQSNNMDPHLKGATPLHLAVMGRHCDIFYMLLRNKVDLNMITSNGKTALHLAVQKDDYWLVAMLLNYHVDSNIPDNDGHCAVFYAQSNEIRNLINARYVTITKKAC